MKTFVLVQNEHQTPDKKLNSNILQQTITLWITKELNHPTKDACAVLPAQAFKINSCQTAAQGV